MLPHATLVYVPILLALCGTLLAVIVLFLPRPKSSVLAAVLLALAALGFFAAMKTGREAREFARNKGQVTEAADDLLDAHQDWADRTIRVAGLAALLAIAAAILATTGSRGSVTFRVLAAFCAVATSYSVYETGTRGSRLAVDHGLGATIPGATAPGDTTPGAFHNTMTVTGFGTAPAEPPASDSAAFPLSSGKGSRRP